MMSHLILRNWNRRRPYSWDCDEEVSVTLFPLKGVAKVYLVGTCGSHVQALNDGRASGSSLPFRSPYLLGAERTFTPPSYQMAARLVSFWTRGLLATTPLTRLWESVSRWRTKLTREMDALTI